MAKRDRRGNPEVCPSFITRELEAWNYRSGQSDLKKEKLERAGPRQTDQLLVETRMRTPWWRHIGFQVYFKKQDRVPGMVSRRKNEVNAENRRIYKRKSTPNHVFEHII